MSNFPSHARVVIIGGGAVGASAIFHLAKAGWKDCVLLEKNELTAGSTWHAAGNVPTFSTSWGIMNMQRYSTELYRGLSQEVDYPMNYHVTGSVRLAHSKERMQEFARALGMGKQQGMSLELLGKDEIQAKYPFVELHDLEGALYDPADGDIDPSQLTQALAKGARNYGAQILRFTPVIGVSREDDEWIVHTEKGDIRCEYVVNAAGYYAARVGSWFKPYGGRDVPMMVMSHQYLLSEEIPEIEAWTNETGHKLPLLRDVDSSYYLRQEKTGFNLGPYENNCKAHWIDPSDPMPDDFSFQLYPDDLDRIEWHIEDAMRRVPLLGTAGINKVINGPIPYAPDGNPLIGPMPGVPNAFEACVFTFGIAQAGGAGKVLAEWITEGATEWDMWSCDPRRFTDYTDAEYCVAKGMEVYGHEYGMHFPHHRWPAAPDRKISPIHKSLLENGAQMGVYGGWERANWYAQKGDDISEEATQNWHRKGPWEIRIQEECEAVRDHCGILDLAGFSRFELKGDKASDWLLRQISGKLPQIGRMNLGYFADKAGRIVTEMSIMRHKENEFTLITAATAQWHDFEWLLKHKEDGVELFDVTRDYHVFIISGPQARALISQISNADLTLPWLTHQTTEISHKKALLARVSFAGELGWEIHIAPKDAQDIWDDLTKLGAKPFGMWALNSLRIEKTYRSWKGDLSTDYNLLEAGLARFIDFNKQNFRGKEALQNINENGLNKRFISMIVACDEFEVPYMSPIWQGDKIIGETTSGAWGYRVNANIALGMIQSDYAVEGAEYEVEIFGNRYKAIIQPDGPLWDKNNDRLRA